MVQLKMDVDLSLVELVPSDSPDCGECVYVSDPSAQVGYRDCLVRSPLCLTKSNHVWKLKLNLETS